MPYKIDAVPRRNPTGRPSLQPRSAPGTSWSYQTLVVTKLDRLARSVPDARTTADELTNREVRLNIGGSVYDPIGKLLFTVLSMIDEFEADLAQMRTREGMAIAKAKGRLRGSRHRAHSRS
jgi:DNA invertase Pin-like site-specific DNA recombinase